MTGVPKRREDRHAQREDGVDPDTLGRHHAMAEVENGVRHLQA